MPWINWRFWYHHFKEWHILGDPCIPLQFGQFEAFSPTFLQMKYKCSYWRLPQKCPKIFGHALTPSLPFRQYNIKIKNAIQNFDRALTPLPTMHIFLFGASISQIFLIIYQYRHNTSQLILTKSYRTCEYIFIRQILKVFIIQYMCPHAH